jgi:hypothetical protein
MNEKLIQIIGERQLVSVMNKTKWRELCGDFEKMNDPLVQIRYKLITSEELVGFSPVWWNEVLNETPAIEWLEFDPVKREKRGSLVSDKEIDMSGDIIEVLDRHNIRYSIEGVYLRVWGYLNQRASPEFVQQKYLGRHFCRRLKSAPTKMRQILA